jgi:hypothetical protein
LVGQSGAVIPVIGDGALPGGVGDHASVEPAFLQYSTLASWLLLPYFLWVSFAAFLNLTIVRMNRPFG